MRIAKGEFAVPENFIVESIRLKVREQIERTEHLIELIPPDRIEWNPQWHPTPSMLVTGSGDLLDYLRFSRRVPCPFPQDPNGMQELRTLPVNHFCRPDEAAGRFEVYARCIEEGFELCNDEDLRRMLPTVFATESVMTLLPWESRTPDQSQVPTFCVSEALQHAVGTGDIYCTARGARGIHPHSCERRVAHASRRPFWTPVGKIMMAVSAHDAVGSCALVPMGNASFEVSKMAVTSSQQNRGIGRRLLTAIIEDRATARRKDTSRQTANCTRLSGSMSHSDSGICRLTR